MTYRWFLKHHDELRGTQPAAEPKPLEAVIGALPLEVAVSRGAD